MNWPTVLSDPVRGDIYLVDEEWRGISGWPLKAFCLTPHDWNAEVSETIDYCIDLDRGYFGRLTQGWLKRPIGAPYLYSTYLVRLGWKMMSNRDKVLEHLRRERLRRLEHLP